MRILALDIGGTAIKAGIVADGNLESRREVPTHAQLGARSMMERITALAKEMTPFDCVGVSTASQVDPHTGVITSANATFPGYTGMPVKQMLEEALHCPVAVDNDVNCAGFAEGQLGAARGHRDFLCLAYGTGIGMAVVLGGELYYGSRFSAGEVGHIRTHAGGILCNCGGRGCYEAYASTSALIRQVEAATSQVLTGREICALAQAGDAAMGPLLSHWVDEVVAGLVSACHMLSPPCVVLGGGIMSNAWVFGQVAQRLPGEVMPNYRDTLILPAALGNDAGMMGAALLAGRLL